MDRIGWESLRMAVPAYRYATQVMVAHDGRDAAEGSAPYREAHSALKKVMRHCHIDKNKRFSSGFGAAQRLKTIR